MRRGDLEAVRVVIGKGEPKKRWIDRIDWYDDNWWVNEGEVGNRDLSRCRTMAADPIYLEI